MNTHPSHVLQPGDVVSVPVYLGTVRHFGVVSRVHWGSSVYVISASKKLGRVAEEPLHAFALGKDVTRHDDLTPAIPRTQVVQRARSSLGESYGLWFDNCEHFVRGCLGLVRRSPQLAFYLAIGLVAALVVGAAFLFGRRRSTA